MTYAARLLPLAQATICFSSVPRRASPAAFAVPSAWAAALRLSATWRIHASRSAGFTDLMISSSRSARPRWCLTAAGPLAEGVFSRSSFALDATKSRPAITAVNAMFKAKSGKDLNDNTARQVTGVQVLADAINRAGSAKPDDIRKALMATTIAGEELIVPWKGVKFDATGQNIDATPVIQQVANGTYVTVYPAAVAVREPVWNVGK